MSIDLIVFNLRNKLWPAVFEPQVPRSRLYEAIDILTSGSFHLDETRNNDPSVNIAGACADNDTTEQMVCVLNAAPLIEVMSETDLVMALPLKCLNVIRSNFTIYPVRSILPNYRRMVMSRGEVYPDKELAEELLRIYDLGNNRLPLSLNFLLTMDNLTEDYAGFTRYLSGAIDNKFPKWKGFSYRGLLLSPMSVFQMIRKNRFYFPSFLLNSVMLRDSYMNEYGEYTSRDDPKGFYHNVMLEVDSRGYDKKSTILNTGDYRSGVTGKSENLFSAYNVFEFVSVSTLKFNDGRTCLLLKLAVRSRDESYDDRASDDNIPGYSEWIRKRGQIPNTPEMTYKQCRANIEVLLESYNRNFGVNLFPVTKLYDEEWENSINY